MDARRVIVTGGQYGSEGKGSLIHHIAGGYDMHIRVGGPQAGHSVKLPKRGTCPGLPLECCDGDDAVLKFQTLPVGSLIPGAVSVIAMTSVVPIVQLEKELGWLRALGVQPQVVVDKRATLWETEYAAAEMEAELQQALGSTNKGVGAARAARIWRKARTVDHARETFAHLGVEVADTSLLIRSYLDTPRYGVLVEAAQGHLLSLFSGGYYPKCTSAESTPAGVFADLGIPLRYAAGFYSLGVFRTTPIRVAGNSGWLPNETTWEELQAAWGRHIPVEQTTVTKKTRRVGYWDAAEARRSAEMSGIDAAALTFLDYPFPACAGATDVEQLTTEAIGFIQKCQADLGVPILWIGTGFGTYLPWRS